MTNFAELPKRISSPSMQSAPRTLSVPSAMFRMFEFTDGMSLTAPSPNLTGAARVSVPTPSLFSVPFIVSRVSTANSFPEITTIRPRNAVPSTSEVLSM